MGKKNRDQKAANVSVWVEFDEERRPARATVQKNGDIEFFDEAGNEIQPTSVKREMSHDRVKGPKVRTSQVLEHTKGAFSGLQHLAEYEVVFAVDTNTSEVDGNPISVAAFMPFSVEPSDEGFNVVNHEEQVQLYEFDGSSEKPELCAILKLTLDLAKHAGIGESSRVAIVTDTELGSLDSFNERKKPIYGDRNLPDGFTLLYASSDTGWEVLNKFIRICDKAAEQTIKERRAGDNPDAPFVSVEEIPDIKIRVGRRNAKLTIENSNITDIGLRPGQKISLFGVEKSK